MNSPAIRFVVLVENRAGRGSFAGHPVIVRLVNELLVSALRPPALFDFPHIIRKSGEIDKTNHEACHFQFVTLAGPESSSSCPPHRSSRAVCATNRSQLQPLEDEPASCKRSFMFYILFTFQKTLPPVCEIRAVHINEELALQGQRVPKHVTSANAGRRSVGVGSEDIFFNC